MIIYFQDLRNWHKQWCASRTEFGKLQINNFTTNIDTFTIQNLDKIFAAYYIFQQCELQLDNLVTA